MAKPKKDKVPTAPNTGSGSGGGGGGGGGKDEETTSPPPGGGGGMSGAERRANAKEAQAKKDLAARYVDQAKTLGQQVAAYQASLGKDGTFYQALRTRLSNIRLEQRQTDRGIVKDYRQRIGSLKDASEDNVNALASQTVASLTNASRERGNALSEAMLQGAGESDTLRSQGMALRNWNANQNEALRAYADGATSIDASATDTLIDSRTARKNAVLAANAKREQQWGNYYDRTSEAQIALGNTYGQMADYYSMANEQVGGKGYGKKGKNLGEKSGDAFMAGANAAGKAWESPGIPKRIRKWDGVKDFTPDIKNRQFVKQDVSLDRPEGATLRKWTA